MARVLLVEDDLDQLELRRLLFERAGHQVFRANSYQEALIYAPAAEVTVMDLRLRTVSTGLQLIRDLKDQLPNMRIIVTSGFLEPLERAPERSLVDLQYEKPVPPSLLLEAVRNLAPL